MSVYLVHHGASSGRNANGVNCIVVDAADPAAAMEAALAAMLPGGRISEDWQVTPFVSPLVIQGNYRGSGVGNLRGSPLP